MLAIKNRKRATRQKYVCGETIFPFMTVYRPKWATRQKYEDVCGENNIPVYDRQDQKMANKMKGVPRR